MYKQSQNSMAFVDYTVSLFVLPVLQFICIGIGATKIMSRRYVNSSRKLQKLNLILYLQYSGIKYPS
jgi:hypothetical protein